MNLSASTYYRYKKRFELYGDEGLLNKTLRVDDSPAQLTYQQRNQVLETHQAESRIRRNPSFAKSWRRWDIGDRNLDDKIIYGELVRSTAQHASSTLRVFAACRWSI